MTDVYRFFGFGEPFIKLINTFTTGRNASIILDDGSLSENFPLEGGHTQGNSPSALQFNFCIQILIFKIEFCPMIESVLPISGMDGDRDGVPAAVVADPAGQASPRAAAGQPAPEPGQGNTVIKDDKVEAFADDASVLAKAKKEAVQAIKLILASFFLLLVDYSVI
jgi:hypothetical protein